MKSTIVEAPVASTDNHPSFGPVVKVPSRANPNYVKDRTDRQNQYLDKSVLLQATASGDAVVSLKMVAAQIARNIELMEFRRSEQESTGGDTSATLLRQSDLLVKLSGVLFELKKIKVDSLDLRSPQFRRVFELFVEEVVNTARDTLPPEHVDLFIQKLSTNLNGWEDKAEALTKQSLDGYLKKC